MKRISIFAALFILGCGGSYSNYNSNNGTASGPEPMDGKWQVKSITCNGTAANSSISSLYSAPNSWTMAFSSSTGTMTLSGNAGACVVTLPISVGYASSTVTISSSGVYSCSPANCSAQCGQNPTIAYSYTYSVSGSSATLLSQNSFDTVCSVASQANPPQYTLTKQ